ncbi:MAG: neuromedin U, partial [Blastocatellia bacterium]
VLNIQPVIPISVSENWNLIVRVITPIIWQPVPSDKQLGFFGLGDMQPTFFFSPKRVGKLIWGAGPAFVLPTATNQTALGQGKLSMGPAFVGLVQPGRWTLGALVNNVWSVAGPKDRAKVNQMLLQYFVNYNLQKGWYLTVQPILTANWEATNGGRWVIPFGGGLGRIMRLGSQPVNISAQFYGNAVHPPGASSWNMRLQIALLFPKAPKKRT